MEKILVLLVVLAAANGLTWHESWRKQYYEALTGVTSSATSAPVVTDVAPVVTDVPPVGKEPKVPTAEEIRAIVEEELKKVSDIESTPKKPSPPWMSWGSWSKSKPQASEESESTEDLPPWMHWANKFGRTVAPKDDGIPGVVIVDDKTANSVYPSQIKPKN